jgi:hypothetical protein
VADSTTQPCGFAGIEKRTSARRLLLGPFDMTLRIESDPLFDEALPWSIQLSAFAVSVCVEPQFGGAWIVQEWVAGVASVFPAASLARTLNWCVPTASPVRSRGDVHAANGALSSEHSKVEPDSLEENVKLALVLVVVAAGPEPIVVSGAVVSGGGWIVQLWLAGVASTLPAASLARTSKLCAPTARPVYSRGEVQAS